MPTIDPDLVPTVNPGDIFDNFTVDSSYNIRWLTGTDPAYYEILNRPTTDVVYRQLVIAKALDNLNTTLGYQALFPFVIPPLVTDGSSALNVPIRIFWDFHVSLPIDWINLRLARIDRLDGSNSGDTEGTGDVSDDYTGTLRFIFTAQQYNSGTSSTEIALFYADYTIDSDLTYQRVRISIATAATAPGFTPVGSSGSATIDGEIIFRTLDTTSSTNSNFLDLLAPGTSATEYEIMDSDTTDPDHSSTSLSHGTGLLTSSAFNLITPVDSDPSVWLESFNYPFSISASRTSNDSSAITIPTAMFREFNITAPAGDAPSNDSTGANFPVWISKIVNEGNSTDPVTLKFYFSTSAIDTSSSEDVDVEFATLTLDDSMIAGQIVSIVPNNDLFNSETSSGFMQDFGKGHVVLSENWGITSGNIDSFFSNFSALINATSTATFGQSATRIGSRGISRVPKYSPTSGQSAALAGTSADFTTPIYPSSTNKYVTEKDEGQGNVTDLDNATGNSHDAIDKYGYKATNIHKLIYLAIDPEKTDDDEDFYTTYALPRLRILLGRDPIFGDEWYNGQRFMKFNGSNWIG